MLENRLERTAVALATFVAAALAAASAVWWVLKWTAPAEPVAPGAVTVPQLPSVPPPDGAAIARLLGANTEARQPGADGATAARLKLHGVLAARSSTSSGALALITVDGKTARPYRVGSTVVDNWVLRSITPRGATLQQSAPGADNTAGPALTLDMPTPAHAQPATARAASP